MKFLQYPIHKKSAARNMAIDFHMLHPQEFKNDILLRFYGWEQRAITFGYSQKWERVSKNCEQTQINCIRRTTGGGIVDHANDLTYCLKIPPTHPCFRMESISFYKALHTHIGKALTEIAIKTILNPCNKPTCESPSEKRSISTSSECFKKAEPYDLIQPNNAKKIAGAALKRNRCGLLVQGSIQTTDSQIPFEIISKAIIHQFHQWLLPHSEITHMDLPSSSLIDLFELKFSSTEWNQKR